MKTKIAFIALMTVCSLSTAYATEGSVGNGGADYIYKGNHYLLDLVEVGNQDAPYLSESTVADPTIRESVKARIGAIVSDEVVSMVARKLSEIARRNPLLGKVYRYEVDTSQFFVPGLNLRNPYLEHSALRYEGKLLNRVAVREGNSIYLNTSLLKQFNPANQSALFVHEWTSAILNEVDDSVDTRKVIGALYSVSGSQFVITNMLMKYKLGDLLANSSRPVSDSYDNKFRIQEDSILSFTQNPAAHSYLAADHAAATLDMRLTGIALETAVADVCDVLTTDFFSTDVSDTAHFEFSYRVKDFTPGLTGLHDHRVIFGSYTYHVGVYTPDPVMNECIGFIKRFVTNHQNAFKY